MKKYMILFLAVLVAFACSQKKEEKTEETKITPKSAVEKVVEYARTEAGNPIVLMKTNMGDLEIEVFENDCPIHAKNFLKLVENEYYDGVIFHRVAKDFVVQGGDPTGSGGGGPGYRLEQEVKPFKYKNKRSYIAMAQSPQGVNGSQFYILVNDAAHLDDKFPCFAKVIKGMDVVDKMNEVKTQKSKPKDARSKAQATGS